MKAALALAPGQVLALHLRPTADPAATPTAPQMLPRPFGSCACGLQGARRAAQAARTAPAPSAAAARSGPGARAAREALYTEGSVGRRGGLPPHPYPPFRVTPVLLLFPLWQLPQEAQGGLQHR